MTGSDLLEHSSGGFNCLINIFICVGNAGKAGFILTGCHVDTPLQLQQRKKGGLSTAMIKGDNRCHLAKALAIRMSSLQAYDAAARGVSQACRPSHCSRYKKTTQLGKQTNEKDCRVGGKQSSPCLCAIARTFQDLLALLLLQSMWWGLLQRRSQTYLQEKLMSQTYQRVPMDWDKPPLKHCSTACRIMHLVLHQTDLHASFPCWGTVAAEDHCAVKEKRTGGIWLDVLTIDVSTAYFVSCFSGCIQEPIYQLACYLIQILVLPRPVHNL